MIHAALDRAIKPGGELHATRQDPWPWSREGNSGEARVADYELDALRSIWVSGEYRVFIRGTLSPFRWV